jgi:glycosyltransferase involved in cell wall biosynthesis
MKISCVCPTRQERRHFLPQVVECFLSQTYADKELVILDEAASSWQGEFPHPEPSVHYHFIPDTGARMTTGRKRNAVNELTTGEIIAHFDDDDWSHPDRLQSQFDTLFRANVDLVGYHDILYYRVNDRSLWKYMYQGRPQPYATGTSQMYFKAAWRSHPFVHRVVGEDSEFSFDFCRRGRLFSEEGKKMIVAYAHASNSYVPNFGNAPFLKAERADFSEEFLRHVRL